MRAFTLPNAQPGHKLFARALLCFLVMLSQPCLLAVHGQEESSEYKDYLAALNNRNHPDHAYAIASIATFRMSPEEELTVVGPLYKATREQNRTNRINANYSLDMIQGRVATHGASVVPALIKLFEDKDEDVRAWAAQVLVQLGEIAIPHLQKALEPQAHARIPVRLYAMLVLGNNGEKAKSVIRTLRDIMEKNPADSENVDAAIAITDIEKDASTIPLLLHGLQNEAPLRVSRAAAALARYGPIVQAHYPLLVRVLLENKDPGARASAANALVAIKAPHEVYGPLISALNKERQHYLEALQRLSLLTPRQQEDEFYKTAQEVLAIDLSRGSIFAALISFRVPIKMWSQQLIDLIVDQPQSLRIGDQEDASTCNYRLEFEEVPTLGSSAVEGLVFILNTESNYTVQRFALKTLGAIGLDAKDAIPALLAAMKDLKHKDIRDSVVEALGLIGSTKPDEVLPVLTEAVESYEVGPGVHRAAATAIRNIARALEDKKATEYIALVERARESMNPKDASIKKERTDVAASLDHLQLIQSVQLTPAWWGTYKKLFPLAAIPPLLLLLWLVMLRFRPLWLLTINEPLARVSDVQLPSWLGGVTLPTRYVLLVGFFHYHPRVLDAWVAARVASVRKRFDDKNTVREHSTHVPIPIFFNGTMMPNAGATNLRQVFDGEVGCLLIKGDGGTGKTNFACLIAKRALSARAETRLCPHLMLPVLLEPHATAHLDSEDAILKFVQTQLKLLARDAEPPDLNLVRNLLRQKRILLIADSLSEMKEPARVAISASIASLSVNASVITSRNDELLSGAARNVVVMSRIEGNFLSAFLGSYLDHLHKRKLFDDEEFFEACRRLTLIVGGRDITVLLAKLYADHMVMSRECTFDEDAPQNVPELFLQYVNRVNRLAAIDSFDDLMVQRGAKLVAWKCLEDQFIPTAVNCKGMLLNPGGPPVEPLINHLEHKLKIVRTVGVKRERVRFTLDPLAEYLACLYIVDEYKSDETKWRQLLDRIGDNRASDIRFFLLALQDCCAVNGDGQVPVAVAKELSRLSGWDHGLERQKQRTVLVNRLTKDLRMLDREELNEIQRSLSLSQN